MGEVLANTLTETALNILKNPRNVLIVSAFLLVIIISAQSVTWIAWGYNSLDMYAHQYEAKTLIENYFSWSLKSATGSMANPHMPVIIYLLAFLYLISGSWVLSYIIILTINAALAFVFIYKLGYNFTGNKLLAAYVTLFFVTIKDCGGVHGIYFPIADSLGLTFVVMTMYALTSKRPRYVFLGVATLLAFFSHFYTGIALFALISVFFLFELFEGKPKRNTLKKYLLPGLSSVVGLAYYAYIYIQMKTGGGFSIVGMDAAGIQSAIKNYNFMEFPFIFGFLHLVFAFVGILLILNRFKNIRGFLTGGYSSALITWTIIMIIPTQLTFLFMSLPLYRMLSYVFISVAIFASIGFRKILEMPKSSISKTIFCLIFIIYVVFSPIAYNVYAMEPAISRDERSVLSCVSENVLPEEDVFVTWSSMIYFSAITNKEVAFDSPVKCHEILGLLESYNVSGAREEMIDMNIDYLYITREPIAVLFRELEGVDVVCSSGRYYLFKIDDERR